MEIYRLATEHNPYKSNSIHWYNVTKVSNDINFNIFFQLTGWRPGTSATDRASTSHSLMRGSYLQSPSVSREGISIISPSARRTAARARARKRISSKLGDNDGYYSNGNHISSNKW